MTNIIFPSITVIGNVKYELSRIIKSYDNCIKEKYVER